MRFHQSVRFYHFWNSLDRFWKFSVIILLLLSIVGVASIGEYLQLHQRTAGGRPPSDGQGLYDACTPWGTTDDNKCFSRLDKMSSGGFKLVVNYNQIAGNASGEIAYLDRAKADGMKVIFALDEPVFWNGMNLLTYYSDLAATCTRPDNTQCQTNTDFITYVINLVKNHPALWGYYIADEVSPTNHAVLKSFTDLIKRIDPNHPRLIVLGSNDPTANNDLATLSDTADVLAQDYYPIGYYSNFTIDGTGTIASGVQSIANQYGKGSGMVLQAQSWREYYPPARCSPYPACAPYPTSDQMRTMLNLTLQNASPRLVLWYSYFDILMSDNPTAHWNDLVTAINSIATPISTPTSIQYLV